jgi:hypothetical protein
MSYIAMSPTAIRYVNYKIQYIISFYFLKKD